MIKKYLSHSRKNVDYKNIGNIQKFCSKIKLETIILISIVFYLKLYIYDLDFGYLSQCEMFY